MQYKNFVVGSSLLASGSLVTYFRKHQSQADKKYELPYFQTAVKNCPKFEKRYKGGEDSWLVSDNSKLIVAADGVGGWGEMDVDPGMFSKQLCRTLSTLYNQTPTESLRQLLVSAVKLNPYLGSTTCVMASIEEGGRLKTCNLGDSGYLLLRFDNHGIVTVHHSAVQQYSFDFPYQCGTYCDLPFDAEELCHKVEHNDVVVMATDGVFDNLFDSQIKSCIKPKQGQDMTQEGLVEAADCIATYAEFMSYQEKWHSPQTQSALDYGKDKADYLGGKEDDITVLVSQIKLRI